MNMVRTNLQKAMPVCGDLLLGETRIRRMPLADVAVPPGARILISNDSHGCQPSSKRAMEERRDALLDEKFAYEIFTFNCEHFVTFVRYGKAVCNQVYVQRSIQFDVERQQALGLLLLKAGLPNVPNLALQITNFCLSNYSIFGLF